MPVAEGTLLWEPPAEVREAANVTAYVRWLEAERGLRFQGYDELWRWSVRDLPGFWASIWDFYGVGASRPYRQVLLDERMPGARWFEGSELNFAEHALRHADDDRTAIVAKREGEPPTSLGWADLRRQVAVTAARLKSLGASGVIKRGKIAQVVMGTQSDRIANRMNRMLKGGTPEASE